MCPICIKDPVDGQHGTVKAKRPGIFNDIIIELSIEHENVLTVTTRPEGTDRPRGILTAKIKYCPFCGRRIKKQEEELIIE